MEFTSSRTISAGSLRYDGAVLEEARPQVTDVIPPDVARTMVAMLEDVVQFGTGVRAKELGRPSAGKTGTTNDFTDAWYIGFTPQITAACGSATTTSASHSAKKKPARRPRCRSGSNSCSKAWQGMPVEDFPNVVPLEKLAPAQHVQVDVPDTAPPADVTEQGLSAPVAPKTPAPKEPEKTALPAMPPAAPAAKPTK